MDLLDEESHRLLVWTVRLDEVGHAPTAPEVVRLAEPRREVGGDVARRLADRAEHLEGALASLVRRGLLERVDADRVRPTAVGRAAADALGLHRAPPAFEVLDADLRSGDPLVFARVVGRIAALDAPMVVDPYCRAPELEYLLAHTGVARVLVSDRLRRDDLDALASVVRAVRGRERPVRLRVTAASGLVDRCVVSGDRVVPVGDLPPAAGAPGATVLAEVHDLAVPAREHYRRLWRRAERVASYRPTRRALRVA